jgi:hypothetical protein
MSIRTEDLAFFRTEHPDPADETMSEIARMILPLPDGGSARRVASFSNQLSGNILLCFGNA